MHLLFIYLFNLPHEIFVLRIHLAYFRIFIYFTLLYIYREIFLTTDLFFLFYLYPPTI